MAEKSKAKSDSGRHAETSPYIDGRKEWLERYGSYIQRARRAWAISMISIFVAAVAVVGNVVQASLYRVVPYVVEINQRGSAYAVAPADLALPVPPRLIQAELATAVSYWRSVTPDLDLQKRFVDRLAHFVTGAAKGQLREWYRTNDPYKRAENSLVQINVTALPAPVSQDSWRVEWNEVVRNHSGVQQTAEAYEATFTIQIQPPTTESEILKNPGGVYITNISFSRVIEPAASSQKKETR